jgi:hypothetical protein
MVLTKHGLWARLGDFVDAHKKITVGLISGMVLLAGAAITSAFVYAQPQPQATAQPTQTEEKQPAAKPKYYSPLTGLEVPDQATTKRQVTAIMIENSTAARPQSGIQPAGVVFEAIAEGGITRFLTLHQEDRPGLIGPVRSLRPYYIDWLAPFDAAVAHIGGSANALKEIRNGTYKDIDQFFNAQAYWRATDRVSPHNVYTSFDRLDDLNKKKGNTSSDFKPWPRKIDRAVKSPTAKDISITVSGPIYNVAYAYDKAGNKYLRSVGGAAHNDREAGRIAPKVVIALKVPTHRGFEDGYREQMTTSGSNTAYIFQDGIALEGLWRKPTAREQIEFYDKAGKPIALNAGQVWVTVIAPEKAVSWQ